MARPYVSAVTFIGGEIVLTVLLDEDLAGQRVEISGYATQSSGAFVNFYDIQPVSASPDGSVVMYVKATPGAPFIFGDDVTVSLRASKLWFTVLTLEKGFTPRDPSAPAEDGTTWNNATAVGWAAGGPPSWSGSQAPAGGESNFQAGKPQ
jgi:hypothetical protein